MDLCSEATGSGATGFGDTRMLPTHLDQLTLNRSEGSTSFTVVSSEDTPPTGKVWDSLLQKPLPPCPSYSPQDSAISSSSPQSTINSPFSFPMTSSPSPPLSQTTPIYCQDEWPDLSMQVETTKVPSFSTEAAGFEPPITHQPALPGKLEIHKLIEAPSGMDEWPGIEANHDRHGNQSLCPDSSPNPLPQCGKPFSSLHTVSLLTITQCFPSPPLSSTSTHLSLQPLGPQTSLTHSTVLGEWYAASLTNIYTSYKVADQYLKQLSNIYTSYKAAVQYLHFL